MLADCGFFPESDLEKLNRYGSHYIGHPTRDVNGVELQEGIFRRFQIVGLPDEHTISGSQEEIFRHYGIDGPGLAATARRLLASKLPYQFPVSDARLLPNYSDGVN